MVVGAARARTGAHDVTTRLEHDIQTLMRSGA
jgi:hypothetical protein